jgi:DNA/RNA-binding domain of Phe-tRNA-synthetase-like protein
MQIKLDGDFTNLFPEASIQVLVIHDLDHIAVANIERWKAMAINCASTDLIAPQRLSEEPEFQEWRSAYSKFGLKPSKFRSSVEQIWKRALQGHLIQTSVKAVDLYCYISLISRVPMGGYDLDLVQGDLKVRLAKDGEIFRGIGESSSSVVPQGIVVYSDVSNIVCFGWNHRDSLHTCLGQNTQRAIFFADSAIDSSRGRARTALDLLSEALLEAGCQVSFRGELDRQNPSLSIGRDEWNEII